MTVTNTRHLPRNRKASLMTQHTLRTATGPTCIAELLRAAGRKLSDRVHAAGDGRARATGWDVTATPGPLGLRGRNYSDPRFGTRQNSLATAARRDGRHD